MSFKKCKYDIDDYNANHDGSICIADHDGYFYVERVPKKRHVKANKPEDDPDIRMYRNGKSYEVFKRFNLVKTFDNFEDATNYIQLLRASHMEKNND